MARRRTADRTAPRTTTGALPTDPYGTGPLALDYGTAVWSEPLLPLDADAGPGPELAPAPDPAAADDDAPGWLDLLDAGIGTDPDAYAAYLATVRLT